MPKAWTNKRERQYQHIKDSVQRRGVDKSRAKEVAARTVNKQRREQGETPNRSSQGTGNPHSALSERTRQELYNRARQLGVKGRSRMSKAELVQAVRSAQ